MTVGLVRLIKKMKDYRMRKVLLAALVIALMPLSAFSAAEKKRVWIAYKEGGLSLIHI